MTRAASKTERVRKTDAEKAQHALDVEQRKVDKFETKLKAARAAVADAETSLAAATKRRDHFASSPDLRVEDAPIDDDELPVDDGDDTSVGEPSA